MRASLLMLLTTCTMLAMTDAPADLLDGLRARVEDAVAPHWSAVDPRPPPGADASMHTLWRPDVGLVYPATWPPNGDGRVVFHVHALGMRLGLMDGAHVGAPWARVVARAGDAKAQPAVEVTAQALTDLGIQGVRPVGRQTVERIDAAQRLLIASTAREGAPSGDDATAMRAGYCAWLGMNGVIAAALRKPQPAFFDWLDCP